MSAGKEIDGKGVATWPLFNFIKEKVNPTKQIQPRGIRDMDSVIINDKSLPSKNFPKEVSRVREVSPANIKIQPPAMFYVHIGRAQTKDKGGIPTHDLQSGRDHCKILMIDGEINAIRDSGSRNGTFVNGRKIPGAAELNIGDLIRVGQTIFKVKSPNQLELCNSDTPAIYTIDEFGEIS